MGLIFANFANFGQIREIKSSRKVWGSPIRENKSPRKTENSRFANMYSQNILIWLIREN